MEGQEAVVPEVVVPEAEVREDPDPEAAAVVPKAEAPERDLAVAAVTEIAEAIRDAKNYLIPKGVPY